MTEITLLAPMLFDPSIGYWTSEPDADALARALAAVPQSEEVERVASADRVTLRGPEELVLEEARLLRGAGLE